MPRAQNVGEVWRVSQVAQLDDIPFDRLQVPHRSRNQLEHDYERGDPKGDGTDPVPVPASLRNGVGHVLKRLSRLSVHRSLLVTSFYCRRSFRWVVPTIPADSRRTSNQDPAALPPPPSCGSWADAKCRNLSGLRTTYR